MGGGSCWIHIDKPAIVGIDIEGKLGIAYWFCYILLLIYGSSIDQAFIYVVCFSPSAAAHFFPFARLVLERGKHKIIVQLAYN